MAPLTPEEREERRREWRAQRERERELAMPAAPLSALGSLPPPRKVVGPSGREYSGQVLCCRLGVSDWPRRRAIEQVEARWFDPLILITILANCSTSESPRMRSAARTRIPASRPTLL